MGNYGMEKIKTILKRVRKGKRNIEHMFEKQKATHLNGEINPNILVLVLM